MAAVTLGAVVVGAIVAFINFQKGEFKVSDSLVRERVESEWLNGVRFNAKDNYNHIDIEDQFILEWIAHIAYMDVMEFIPNQDWVEKLDHVIRDTMLHILSYMDHADDDQAPFDGLMQRARRSTNRRSLYGRIGNDEKRILKVTGSSEITNKILRDIHDASYRYYERHTHRNFNRIIDEYLEEHT